MILPGVNAMTRALVLFVTLLAAACAAPADNLASIKGPLVPLNPSHWQPTQAEMATLAARVEADK